MRRTLSSVVSGVGTLSSAVSTTMVNLATEDNDLAEFGDSEFASDLRGRLDRELRSKRRKKQKEKELSVDSGVSTEPLNESGSNSNFDDDKSSDDVIERVSSTERMSSSLSVSSDDEFIQGLSFLNLNEQVVKDEITSVTDDILTTSDSDEFSLGTVDITSTEVFLARKRRESADSRTFQRSLNHSGNLSELRRSFNDLSLTPRPISSTTRSKSTTTLSPFTDESTRKNTPFDTVKSRSELTLNTIREIEKSNQERSVQVNNYFEISHQDPTTIESFDSSSGELEHDLDEHCNTLSGFDEDEDLLEKKDPFRESFLAPKASSLRPKTKEVNFSPIDCVKRKTFHNFNVGSGPGLQKTSYDKLGSNEADNADSIIETISELSNKSQKSCSISRKTPVKLKPLPKINAHLKTPDVKSNQYSGKINSNSNTKVSTLTNRFENQPESNKTTSSVNIKRKNYLAPPSQKKTPNENITSKIRDCSPWSLQNSLTPRSISCTNLNSRTEDPLTRSGTLDGFNSLDKTKSYADLTYTPVHFSTESSPTADIAEKSVTQIHSSFLSQQAPGNSFDSMDGSSRKNSAGSNSSSTFYSFSSEEHSEPKVILNGKSSKSFMVSMRNSFKRLASFLSLSKNKKEKGAHEIIPVPPPPHTKPDTAKVGKNRQYVRPVSPSLAKEFNQRSRSCGNILNNVQQQGVPMKQRALVDSTFTEISVDIDSDRLDKTRVSDSCSSKKKLAPPPSLINHITNHYTKPNQPKFSSSNPHGFGSLSANSTASRTRKSTSVLYRSSPSTLLPSPPMQRKPIWRDTKSSRLRLNRVKAPSMSTLNF